MKLTTSKNQTLSGVDADTVVLLAVIGAVTIFAGTAIVLQKTLTYLEERYPQRMKH